MKSTKMSRLQQRTGEEIYDEDSLCKSGPKSVFGKYSDAEMVAQLKGLALDPCKSESSETNIRNIRSLRNQALRVRKAMALALPDVDFRRRKRKLQELLKDLPGFGPWLSNQRRGTKLSRGQVSHASSASCLLNSREFAISFGGKIGLDSHSSSSLLTFEDDILEKQICSESPFVDEAVNLGSPCKDVDPLVDSDESVNCWNADSPENVTSHEEVPSLNTNGISHLSDSQVQETPIRKHLQPPRRSLRSLNCIDDDLQRMVIPVGPRFQADVPEWTGPQKVEDIDSRWLGTRIWPIEGGRRKEIVTRAVGQGRPDSCSCSSPASVECVQRHIIEERLLLLCDLGSAFFRMKVDEAGEQISKSWTLEEQHNFQLLARKNPLSDGKDFLKHAFKCFPFKCRKAIMSYYFNVFIPRRMSQQTRSSKQIDTDDDEEEEEGENFNCSNSRRKSEQFQKWEKLIP